MRQLPLWHSAFPSQHELAHAQAPRTLAPTATFPGMTDLTAVAQWLSGHLALPVSLTITDNRATMVSFRFTVWGLYLRLHRVFLAAKAAPMTALLAFLRGDKAAGKILDAFVNEHADALPAYPEQALQARGLVHDLGGILAVLNDRYFHGGCAAQISWGVPRAKAPRRHLPVLLGTYLVRPNLICIHPCLDQHFVPAFFVEWIVLQQMLHELFGHGLASSRAAATSGDWQALQKSFPAYAACEAWEKQNASRLLQYKTPPRRDRGARKLPRWVG